MCGAVRVMEVGPPRPAVREEAANRRLLRRVNARGGERDGKGPALIGSGVDREGERERTTDDVSKWSDDIKTGE